MLEHLIHVNTWFPKYEADLAEQTYYTVFSQKSSQATTTDKVEPVQQASLSDQIRDVRKVIVNNSPSNVVSVSEELTAEQRLAKVEKCHEHILQMLDELKRRVNQLEVNEQKQPTTNAKVAAPAPKPAPEDDDVDLFGSEDEEESAETKRRLAEYAAKKATKTQIIAKSSITLDVKPWDDETDLEAMEKAVRSIVADGLIWGPSKQVPVAFGVKKLQIGCVVEDDKIGTDFLEEKICEFEDYVQSVDIFAFNKI